MKFYRILLLAVGISMLPGAFLTAKPLNPTRIPDDASWFAHLDVSALVTSKLGQNAIATMEPQKQRQLRVFERMFGFSLLEDLKGITLYGIPGYPEQGVLLLEGSFEQEHLLDLIAVNEAYESGSYRSHTVHKWWDEKEQKLNYGAFVTDQLIAISDNRELVTVALDVMDGVRSPMSPRQMDGFPQQPGSQILVVGLADFSEINPNNPQAATLQDLETGMVSLSTSPTTITLDMLLEAKGAETAENIANILTGIRAVAMMNKEDPKVKQLAEAVQIVRSGESVQVNLDYPIEDTIDSIDPYL